MSIIPRRFYLDDFFDDFVPSKNDMKCDIYEKEGKHHMQIDVPGFKKEDIKIEAKNGYLTITAEKNNNEEEKDKNYIRQERIYSKVQRSFYLGNIDENDIEAKYEDGTLKISIPKKEQIENKKYIEIK